MCRGLSRGRGSSYTTNKILWFDGRDFTSAGNISVISVINVTYVINATSATTATSVTKFYKGRYMALATKPPLQEQQRTIRRIWKTPGSKFNWVCLAISILAYGYLYKVYLDSLKSNPYAGPYTDPLRLYGIVSFVLVLLVAAYTLRRRFVRILPGKVQNWLWLHTWFGILAILVAFMHENYLNIIHDLRFTQTRFTEGQAGTSALYALLLLVLTGIIGRLLDIWQARTIAKEANINGAGIIQVVEERLHESNRRLNV